VTLGGGFGKLTKFAQGAVDLHSSRSQVDFGALAAWAGDERVAEAPTAMAALALVPSLADAVAREALVRLDAILAGSGILADVVVVDREGRVAARAGP